MIVLDYGYSVRCKYVFCAEYKTIDDLLEKVDLRKHFLVNWHYNGKRVGDTYLLPIEKRNRTYTIYPSGIKVVWHNNSVIEKPHRFIQTEVERLKKYQPISRTY